MSDFIRVAALDEIPANGSKLVEVDDVRVALFNLDGELYAIEDVCTHDGGPLVEGEIVAGCQVECPRHGAAFGLAARGHAAVEVDLPDVAAGRLLLERGPGDGQLEFPAVLVYDSGVAQFCACEVHGCAWNLQSRSLPGNERRERFVEHHLAQPLRSSSSLNCRKKLGWHDWTALRMSPARQGLKSRHSTGIG